MRRKISHISLLSIYALLPIGQVLFKNSGPIFSDESMFNIDLKNLLDSNTSIGSTAITTTRTYHRHHGIVAGTFLVPEMPDLSIGEMLRDIIRPPAHDDNVTTDTSPISNCSPTSQLKIVVYNTTDCPLLEEEKYGNTRQQNQETPSSCQKWIVEAYDEMGERKTQGGDEIQISFSHNGISNSSTPKEDFRASAIAIPTDNNDGTYSLDFSTPTLSPDFCANGCPLHGTLKISLVYTCHIGRMTRPSKDTWKHGGFLRGKTYFLHNISAPTTIRKFQGPMHKVDLSKFDKVICFGDSLTGNMCGFWWNKFVFKKQNTDFIRNVGSSIRGDLLYNETFPMLEEMHGKDLRKSGQSTAVILGSAAWEMSSNLGPYPGYFFNHSLQMYQDLVIGVRERYPNVTIFWKSPQAVHLTVLEDDCYSQDNVACTNRVRYMSNSILQYLHQEQKRIMALLNVSVLDIFDATYLAESWHMGGDSLHYRHWLNRRLIEYFYPKS